MTLSAEGIALLEHATASAGRPANVPQLASIDMQDVARRNAALRLFVGPVRHVELSAEDAAPLLKLPERVTEKALDELTARGELVKHGAMYRLPGAAQRELPAEVDLSAAARDLGRRGGLKGGPARAAGLSPERRSEISHAAARARWERDQAQQQGSTPESDDAGADDEQRVSEPAESVASHRARLFCRLCGVLFAARRTGRIPTHCDACRRGRRHTAAPTAAVEKGEPIEVVPETASAPSREVREPAPTAKTSSAIPKRKVEPAIGDFAYIVRVDGLPVKCRTLGDVVALVERYGEGKRR